MVKRKSHRTRDYLALILIESTSLLPEGVNGRFLEIRQTLKNLTKIRVKKIETQGKQSRHWIRVHAMRIRKSEEHAIIHSYMHEENELRKRKITRWKFFSSNLSEHTSQILQQRNKVIDGWGIWNQVGSMKTMELGRSVPITASTVRLVEAAKSQLIGHRVLTLFLLS